MKRLIKQIAVLTWVLFLVCGLCLPGAALAQGEALETAGIQASDLEKGSVDVQSESADLVVEQSLRAARASLQSVPGGETESPGETLAGATPATWTNLNPANPPANRYGFGMVYDDAADRTIVVGGLGPQLRTDTWAYDYTTNTWTSRIAVNPFALRFGFALAYDASANKVILFGGWSGSTDARYNDTWAYDYASNSWTNCNPSNPPPGRTGGAMVYDASAGKVILFGGWAGPYYHYADYLNDTWAYDYAGNTWTNRNPINPPSVRDGHAMAYDISAGKMLLFGGGLTISHDPGEPYSYYTWNDTWAYEYIRNTWTNLTPSNPPSVRIGHAMTYEAFSGKVILFGGWNRSTPFFNDTWAYDWTSNSWTNLNLSSAPPGRVGLGLVYHASAAKVILFGGAMWGPDDSCFNDTWALSMPKATLTYHLVAGWNMISVPLDLANPLSKWVFPESWPIYSWDAANARYSSLRYVPLLVGAGYWLKAPSAQTLIISGPPNEAATANIPLWQGWNLIGTPYDVAVSWSTVVVRNGLNTMSLDQAISLGWIKTPLYCWTGASYQGLSGGGAFLPLSGYWVKVPIAGSVLIFTKP
ncbi:MAG: hypothetical protein NTV14_00185 [Coprothermobacterota bacterium]|nr:hypothetical protein [Coprothermobacterota bacterium]